MDSVVGFKLFNRRKNGTLGPLFINRRQVIQCGEWMDALCIPTKGYFVRPGWHACKEQSAPHLSTKGRVWARVALQDITEHIRPQSQGGVWFTANRMMVMDIIE